MTSPGQFFRRATRLTTFLALFLTVSSTYIPSLAQSAPAPGGFLEKTTSGDIRPRLSAAQIQGLLPVRGPFTFPLPYNTEAVRITNAGDCGGSDCLNSVGYSYWRNINNHAASDTMYIFLGLDKSRGGTGPTLFGYNKVTDVVTNMGSMFVSGSPYSNASAEGWYFSATMPNAVYMNSGSKMLRYDVVTKQVTTIFDAAPQYGSVYIWQMHSSDDDRVHIATVRSNSNYAMLGCVAYREDTSQFSYFAAKGVLDECHLDKGGRYMVMLDNVDGAAGEDNRIVDLTTGTERLVLDQAGAAGHGDMGHGYMLNEDDWNNLPGAAVVRKMDTLTSSVVYHSTDWNVDVGHVTHTNSRPGIAPEQQFACSSNANRLNLPRANEIVCYRLDSSLDVLIVAPVMTDLNASGGGDDYTKKPKGNIDPTGQYLIWTSNMGGGRLDAFIVKVPSHRLTGTGLDVTPPVVAVTAPLGGLTVSGSVTVVAGATDDVGVTGVQFKLDGANLGAEKTAAPWSILWNTATASNGSHVLTATGRDSAGNSTTSAPITVTVNNVVTAPSISSVASSGITSTGATITWTTNLSSDSQVEYGTTTAYGSSTTVQTSLVTSHSMPLTGLSAGTLYHYRVKSKTASGATAVSADNTVTMTAAPVTGAGLVGRWSLDELSGSTVFDSSTNAANGTLRNGPTRVTGKIGRAVSFDGKNDLVNIGHRNVMNAYPLTVALWMKGTGSGAGALLSKYYSKSYNGYQVFMSGGKVCAWYFRNSSNRVYDGSSCPMGAAGYNDGQWHHVAFVVDAAGGRLFIDGAQKSSLAWQGTPGAPSTMRNINLARYGGATNTFFAGSLDDVQLYNRALTAAELQSLHAAGGAAGDTTPPTISSAAAGGITGSGATISWTTNESSDSQLEYGVSATYGTVGALDPALVTAHSRTLTGLYPGTLYHYRVRSRDAAGNLAVSGDFTFTTPAVGSSAQDVNWANVVNCSVQGSSIQKNGGYAGSDDAAGVSLQQIVSGDGALEFTFTETETLRFVGLSSGTSGTRPGDIEFAIRIQAGIADVRENGVYRSDTTTVAGDVFKITIQAGRVTYSKNGTVFYASALTPSYPLVGNAALLDLGSSATNVKITGGI